MKRLLFFLLAANGLLNQVSAQTTSKEIVADAPALLADISEQLQKSDKAITHNIYGNVSSSTIDEYRSRYAAAIKILDELDKIDRAYKEEANNFPNEKDHLLYGIITKLTSLRITGSAGDYINFLTLDTRGKKQYDDIKDSWDRKSNENVKAIKSLINKLQAMGVSDSYTQTLSAICLYYDNKKEKAINDLTSITGELKEKIAKDKDAIAENSYREKIMSFAMSWLSYLYYSDAKIGSTMSVFKAIKDSINEPDNGSMLWMDMAGKQISYAKSKTADRKICEFSLPENVSFYDVKTLLYEKGTINDRSQYAAFNSVVKQRQIINDQKELIDKTIKNWEELSALENTPISLFIDKMRSSSGKLKKSDYKYVFQKMTPKNKGGGEENLLRYRDRFDKAYAVLQEFFYLRQCWTNIIASNPDVPFFRLYRTKVDLGISYLSQNKQSFLSFFDYYKIKGDKISDNDLRSIKEDFSANKDKEIRDDLDRCSDIDPNNITYKLAELEVLVLTGDARAAMTSLNALEAQIPSNTTIDDIDPKSVLELYKSYLYLKMPDLDKLRLSVQPLNSYPNTTYWSGQVKEYQYYFENVNQIK